MVRHRLYSYNPLVHSVWLVVMQRSAGDEALAAWHATLINAGKEAKEILEVSCFSPSKFTLVIRTFISLRFFGICIFIVRVILTWTRGNVCFQLFGRGQGTAEGAEGAEQATRE